MMEGTLCARLCVCVFSWLFEKPKEEPTTLATLGKLSETLEMLERKESVLKEKIAVEVEKAKAYIRVKNKRAGIQCLMRKKLYEVQVEQLGNFQLRIHVQMNFLEGAKATIETVDALSAGASAMKAMHKSTNIDSKIMNKIMDEINEQTENIKKLWSSIQILQEAADFDEDELDAELEELEGSVLEEQLLQCSYSQTTASSSKAARSTAIMCK